VEIGAASTRSRASRSRARAPSSSVQASSAGGGRRRAPHHLGQQAADARAQLGGGLLGVRDDDDAIDRGVGGEQQVDDLVLEEVGLAGAGGGLDDEQPGVRIAERGGARPADGSHRRPPRRPNSGW
jgi:hypothetical protein